MFNISQFLERLKKISGSSINIRIEISKVISKQLGLEIPIESIEIKLPKIYIKNISQAARSEIFIKKEAILKEINKGCVRPLIDIK